LWISQIFVIIWQFDQKCKNSSSQQQKNQTNKRTQLIMKLKFVLLLCLFTHAIFSKITNKINNYAENNTCVKQTSNLGLIFIIFSIFSYRHIHWWRYWSWKYEQLTYVNEFEMEVPKQI